MRLATIALDGRLRPAVVRDDDMVVPIDTRATGLAGIRAIAAGGPLALDRLAVWLDAQPADAATPLSSVTLGPAVPDPGAIYTVGLNYDGPAAAPRPDRPLIYGKAARAVAGHGATLAWDRAVTDDVDAEVELAVVIGAPAFGVAPENALGHVFGYTIIDDVSARDEHLDGDQWLLGKSMPGFCPAGPWIVTADAFDPSDVALGCRIDGEPIQEDRTSRMRFPIAEVVSYLSRHLELRPGDLIATGTPVRLGSPPGPGRRLRAGDRVTAWIEGIGELTTTIA
ncbi:MAG TPA: fumarylacetoacetate hydrolase family protein [Candidatus Limnocylindrales bacterium]|nr:fumarylacetoacetate hydrolase family protein [Candidatus Limnocylindrales bacterium]